MKAIEEGILKVGIGKYGSESIPDNLAKEIIKNLENPLIPSIQKGALLGALFLKGFKSEGEKEIQKHFSLYVPEDIIQRFCKIQNENLKTLILKLLNGQTLNFDESFFLGEYLFDESILPEDEFEIGLITTILRFRYETIEEYTGLMKAIEKTFHSNWTPLPEEIAQKTIILTDPFDGFDGSYSFSPLIGNLLIQKGFIPVFIVSDNPGPKLHYNLKNLAVSLKSTFIKSTEELLQYIHKKEFNHYGFFIDVEDLAPILKKWIQRRKLIKKRPFLATLERVYNPVKAHIQIFSAFHPPYLEKTTEILMNKQIPIIYGIRRGEEGGLTFSYNKKIESLLSIRKESGYEQIKNSFFSPSTLKLNFIPEIEDNKNIIEQFLKNKDIEFSQLKLYINLNKNEIEEYKSYIVNQIKRTIDIYNYFINFII